MKPLEKAYSPISANGRFMRRMLRSSALVDSRHNTQGDETDIMKQLSKTVPFGRKSIRGMNLQSPGNLVSAFISRSVDHIREALGENAEQYDDHFNFEAVIPCDNPPHDKVEEDFYFDPVFHGRPKALFSETDEARRNDKSEYTWGGPPPPILIPTYASESL